MSLEPLLLAPSVIQAHIAAALASVACGVGQIAGTKRGQRHHWLGWTFVAAMTVTAMTSFWITRSPEGRFSAIHLLSVTTLITLPLAVIARRQGRIKSHAIAMSSLVASLLIAGLFTLLPYRILGKAVFGPS